MLVLAWPAAARAQAARWEQVARGVHWGESSRDLLERWGRSRAAVLPRPVDFGDSYAEIALRNVAVGGVALTAFFQMDKATRRLKRIQFVRQRHGVNPPAFRAVLAALETAYGPPDRICGVPPGPRSGYQAAAEHVWRRDDSVIRAIFRDTTIAAFEGCVAGDPGVGPCGLTGQLLVRISPLQGDPGECPAAAGAASRG